MKYVMIMLIGAVIGYITNDIAIKMLFHPRKEYYIGKFRVPFTPGLIPKEKNRVARSLGNVISNQLLNSEILLNTLTSDEMLEKIRTGLIQIVDANRFNQSTVSEVMAEFASEEVSENTVERMKKELSELLYSKMLEMDFKSNVTIIAENKIKEYVRTNPMLVMMAQFINDDLIHLIAEGIGETTEYMIKNHSSDTISHLLEQEVEKLLDMKICEVITSLEEKLPDLIEFVVSTYRKVLNDNLPRILEGINLAKIVEDRVASFDVIQLEEMIFGIMKKELNAIVYLGALLGFLMGGINVLIDIFL